jgi:hypothetical protein
MAEDFLNKFISESQIELFYLKTKEMPEFLSPEYYQYEESKLYYLG